MMDHGFHAGAELGARGPQLCGEDRRTRTERGEKIRGLAEEKVIAFGDCELNLATRVLTRAGAPVSLTTGEFALLKALVTHPRHPLSRDKLMELARGRDHDPFDRAIDVQVSRLRKLVEPDPAKPRFIQTVWGHGYVFVPDGVKS